MGRYTLENDQIAIAVDSHGAELKSLVRKDTQTEYMWKADPGFWGRTAPVLFPFVGAVNNKEFRTKGQTFTMGQHGFARDMEFELESKTEDALWFVLNSSEETLAKYPYAFVLKIGYRLCDSSAEVIWQVENPSDEELPFSIGGHPAFNCPIEPGKKQTDYQISFDVKGPITSTRLEDGLASAETDVYELKDGFLPVTEHLFDKDALIIEGQGVKKVALCDAQGKAYLTVSMDAPLFGIWSPTGKNAPFICIEPWYGRCDDAGYTGELKDRKWGNLLAPGQTWKESFTISV
ncbi:MAG: aldose 1-epimerase family protein [Agathobacter sp.]